MMTPELEMYDSNPEWGVLLAAYRDAIVAGDLEWAPRIALVEGLVPEAVSSIHGKLIAMGMLKFEISGRTEGVQYQLTTLGKQALIPPSERVLTPEWMLEAEAPAA